MKVSLKVLISFLIVFLSQGVFAQQITKFGVVDTARVYNAYVRYSAALVAFCIQFLCNQLFALRREGENPAPIVKYSVLRQLPTD